jgi:hypothetical protein
MMHLGKRLARPLAVGSVALISTAVIAASPGTAVAGSAATAASHSTSQTSTADAGTLVSHVSGHAQGGRTVTGTFTPTKFFVTGKPGHKRLMATGTLDAVITGHGTSQETTKTVTMPVRSVNGSVASLAGGGKGMAASAVGGACQVLHLDLGPLNLNLLGLKVHLNEVVLDITAQPGAGNLLGNLLCAVAGLLDNNGPLGGLLGQVSGLLNQILGQLGLLQL